MLSKCVPRGPVRSNCFFWAVARWLKKGRNGELVFRRSDHNPLKFHCMFVSKKCGRIRWGYSPDKPVSSAIALLHGVRFRGTIKRER